MKAEAISHTPFVSFPRRFTAPPVTRPVVSRPAAEAALDAALDVPLTVVFGNTGYGKTSLLSQWLEGPRCASALCMWYRAEPRDLDFSIFVSEWLHQLQRTLDSSDTRHKDTTSLLQPCDIEMGLAAVHDLICRADRPVLLVIDEFQEVDHPDFTQPFLRALRNLPPNLHVVLASPSMPRALIDSAGGAVEVPLIGPDRLALSAAEIAELTGDHAIDASALAEATGGWPAIIHLVVDALKEGATPDLETLLGTDAVHLYVSQNLLGGLDTETRIALTGLASLQRVPVDLAVSAVGEAGAEKMTAAAERLWPLFRLDESSPASFEYHPMMLRSLVRHRVHLPARVRQAIDTKVVDWRVRQHQIGPALEYALRHRMRDKLVWLAEYYGPHTITLHAGVPLLRATIDAIDADVIRRSARLLIGRATVLMKDGRFALAKSALDEAAVLLNEHGEATQVFGSPQVDLVNARYLMMLYINDEFDESFISDELSEIRQLSVEEGIVGFVYALRSIWFQRRALFRRAENEAARSLYHYRKAGSGYGEASVLMVQGLAALGQGRLQKAENAYAGAAEIIQQTCPDDPGLNATCATLQAELMYERNEIDAAAELLVSAIDTLEESDGWLDPFASAYRVGVGICLARGDDEGALIFTDRAAQLAAQRGLVEIERLAQLHRVDVHLRCQQWREAKLELERYDGFRASLDRRRGARDMTRELELAALIELRFLLGHGELETAKEKVKPMITAAEREGRYLQLTRLKIIEATALWKHEQDRAALDIFREAVELASGKGYIRAFVDGGIELVPLLRALLDHGMLSGPRASRLVRGMLRAIDEEQRSSGLAQQFSARELQVITYLSRGQSNKQIARHLDVTESTIKFHLKKIFTRLGVNKRASAVVEARRQGLI